MSDPTDPLQRLWQDLQKDTQAIADMRAQETLRKQVSPPLLAFIDRFINGDIDVEQFKREFDAKTRKEWDGFGLKGMSAGMLLNKLVNHLGSHRSALEQELRRALVLPTSHDRGIVQIRGLMRWVSSLIESGVTTKADLQPRRIPVLLSALWYVRKPAEWPAYYQSMRDRLEDLGLFEESDDVADSYFRFAEIVRRKTKDLGLHPWEFEFLCEKSRPAPASMPGPATEQRVHRIWLWSAGRNAGEWPTFQKQGVASIGFGADRDLREFTSVEAVRDWLAARRKDGKRPTNDALAGWQVVHDVRAGDTVYIKKGRSNIVGRGIVTEGYRFEQSRKPFPHVCTVRWEWSGDVDTGDFLVTKTLTDITDYPELVTRLARVTRSDASVSEIELEEEQDADEGTTYTLDDAEKELFWPRADLEKWLQTLAQRKNVILQGPPGVGKTFVAARLADLLIGRSASGHKVLVQFHPSYGYEDFVQGYRPTKEAGYERVNGPFLELCKKALQDPADKYVVIIDEINRAHLGKVLGELMMLIEADKRDPRWGTSLAYGRSDEAAFHVPPNLHIIGTMNTADRSIALVDYALRRRFSFVELGPALDKPAFEAFLVQKGVSSTVWKRIEKRVRSVNQMLAEDPSLGEGYLIGHSFFCSVPSKEVTDEWFQDIVEQDLAPLLREYWFDRRDQFEKARAILVGEE